MHLSIGLTIMHILNWAFRRHVNCQLVNIMETMNKGVGS